MTIRGRSAIALLAATALLSVVSSAAIANTLQINNSERGFRIAWTPLTITYPSTATVRCNLTLEGSFAVRTFAKVTRNEVGHITRATLNSCVGGSATFLTARLPQNITYSNFGGTLPTILIVILRAFPRISITPSGSLACLLSPPEEEPWIIRAQIGALGEVNSVVSEEGAPIRLLECAERVRLSGTGTSTVLGETAKIAMSLK